MQLKLTQAQLAAEVGGSNKSVSNMEYGRNWPSIPIYMKLCKALRTPPPPLIS